MNINQTLKQYFGYDSLRTGQEELIDGILQGKDVLGIMPTGAGKSLCYQLPALLLEGITIVISPLISLMSDQVKTLNQAGVHAAYINSSLTENQIRTALSYASQGRYKIIYVAPERLNTGRFLDFACNSKISMVTVDEAHCISQWGQDFRPSYLEIAEFLVKLPWRPIVSAFTATATQRVRDDIIASLRLHDPVTVVTGFDRPNLFFRVVTRKGGRETNNSILNYVKKHEDESGIIYGATKVKRTLPMTGFVSWLPPMLLVWESINPIFVMYFIIICLKVWSIIIKKREEQDEMAKKRNVFYFSPNKIS